MMINRAKIVFIIGGGACFAVALLHIAIIIGGEEWYRFFGAGEDMAIMARQGSLIPAIVTAGITLVFTIWGFYGLSGAGFVKPLPFLKPIIVLISLILILRGLGLFAPLIIDTGRAVFVVLTSLISLSIGLCYAIGAIHVWKSGKLKSE